ncbi:MAG: type III-A CRISPR-associated RAMP protein Csm3 [Deltaproteobacteria bacterium]|nr:type III-A CRISPR-associated RAMP protein Csm3 [Deltaproteobacteria bacterium]MBW2065537.1 type III-A CRISPR-associated RAMP protein Csm3 [Deltaproteobacteria bacterium]
MTGKLQKKLFINGKVQSITGLAIGGSSIGLEIGGADKVVVRNPITNLPYIPGSSLKGKMRSLLEKYEGRMNITVKMVDKQGNVKDKKTFRSTPEIPENLLASNTAEERIEIEAMPCKCGECMTCQIFGTPAEEKKMLGRLIVRDSDLVNAEQLGNSKNTDMPYTEVKTEVVIDRITSAATPRQFERVPAGAVFGLQLVCNIYEGDDEAKVLGKIFEALCLVQDDYLGGSGTRGYGQVKFNIESVTYKDQGIYENNEPPKPLDGIKVPDMLREGDNG